MTRQFRNLSISVLSGLALALAVVAAASAASAASHQPAGARYQSLRQPSTTATLPYTSAVYATSFGPSSLDPALAYDSQSDWVIGQIYEPLLTYQRDRADVHVPLLASGWTISPDGQTYTFTLRPGIQFQNGAPLIAQDVAFSFWRGILGGDANTPQWLILEALFNPNYYDVTQLVDPSGVLVDDRAALQARPPAVLQAACNTVKNAVTYDNAAWTVTFHLPQAYGPLLDILAAPWSSVLNQAWLAAHGGWNGDCTTWQNYYATAANSSPIVNITNGTGPYALQSWDAAGNVRLTRNNTYWRNIELWLGAPTGPAALQTVDIEVVPTSSVRSAMLLSGQADFADIYKPDPALSSSVLLRYSAPDGIQSSLGAVTGTLRSYSGLLASSATDGLFMYNISTGGPRNYVGSGTLNGQGIPPNFFTDIHVRKAFNFAFDWDTYILQAFSGQALQRKGPIIKGILGYSDAEPSYSYSPTLALQEFGQAWGGQVLSNGFAMTVTYNTANTTSQVFANVLKTGIEGLTSTFHVNVVALPWPSYLADLRNQQVTLFAAGWLEDIPHPNDWVVPYLAGTYSGRQQLPAADGNYYLAEVTACRALIDAEAQTCYENLQASTYYSATDIFLAQQTFTQYIRAEVRGYYANLAFYNLRSFYDLSKGPLPTVQSINAATDQIISATSANGALTAIEIPAGTLTDGVKIALTTDTGQYTNPAGFQLGHLTFAVDVYDAGGDLLPSQVLSSPVTITIHYNAATLGVLTENNLTLFRWDGSAYVDAACGPYVRDLVNHALQVAICHLSQFALGGTTHSLFLSLVSR